MSESRANSPHLPVSVAEITVSRGPDGWDTLHVLCCAQGLLEVSNGRLIAAVSAQKFLPPARAHSSLLYATTPSSLRRRGSDRYIACAAWKYSSAIFVDDNWRCSIPMKRRGK